MNFAFPAEIAVKPLSYDFNIIISVPFNYFVFKCLDLLLLTLCK
jgi:Uracil phosphoribosyltransferase